MLKQFRVGVALVPNVILASQTHGQWLRDFSFHKLALNR